MKLVLVQSGSVTKEVEATHEEYVKLRELVEDSLFKWEIYLQRPCIIRSIDSKLLGKWKRYIDLHGVPDPDYGTIAPTRKYAKRKKYE